jgi:hypothetical protein
MAKASKTKRPIGKDEKLKINGSCLDLMQATVKDAERKSAPKKKGSE